MIARASSAAALLGAVLVLVACPPGPSEGPGDGDGDGDIAGDGDGDTDAGLDLTRDPACDKGKWLVVLNATATLEGGLPAEGAFFQTCVRTILGTLICLDPRPIGSDGSVEVVVPEAARCVDQITARVFQPAGGYTTAYCHLDIPEDEPIVSVTDNLVLHATTPATSLEPLAGGDEEIAHEVVFPGGLAVEIIPIEYFADRGPLSDDPSYNHLSAAVFDEPGASELCFLGESPPMFRVFGFAPEGDLGVRAPVRFGPTPFAPGAEVPLYALGGLSCLGGGDLDDAIAEGDWEAFATGTVDEEGYVVAGGAAGLPCLIWMGVGYPDAATDGGLPDGG